MAKESPRLTSELCDASDPSSIHSPIFTFVNVSGSLDDIREDIGRQLREMELENGLVEVIQKKVRLVGVGEVREGGCEVCGTWDT